MTRALLLLSVLAAASAAAPAGDGPAVDLPRYMGEWREIAHLPNYPQRGCTDTVVRYTATEDGGFDLVNACWKGAKYKPYRGHAAPSFKGATNKFRAKFFFLLSSDYWIVDLDPDYRWAAVGNAKKDQFWVISRTKELDPSVYDGILARARANGYDLTKLERTALTGKEPPAP